MSSDEKKFIDVTGFVFKSTTFDTLHMVDFLFMFDFDLKGRFHRTRM